MTRRTWVLGAALLALTAGGVWVAIAGAHSTNPADCCADPTCPPGCSDVCPVNCPAADCCLDPACPPGCSPECPPNCDGGEAKTAPKTEAKGYCPPCPFCP